VKTIPAADGRRPGIFAARWLGLALLGLLASDCCPHPPGFIPRIPSECGNWDSTTTLDEIRAFANDLADLLPDWHSTGENLQKPGSVRLDYGGLKAAAIKMARAPRCVQWAVIESYYRAYCDQREYDRPKCSKMLPLMRVLFVVPTRDADGTESKTAWPVRPDPSGRVLEIDHYQGMFPAWGTEYNPRSEYAHFVEGARFPIRTPAEIQALEIRARP
jgi:hypothetical protein